MLARRWFSFQNMGPGPSSRCGHTLTTSRDKIIVLGGESQTNVSGKDESTVSFILDTAKIRFPSDTTGKPREREKVQNFTSPIAASYPDRADRGGRPTSRGGAQSGAAGIGGSGADSVGREMGAKEEMVSRIPRGPPSVGGRIRSPSPPRGGGSLPSRGASEQQHTRNTSSGTNIPQQSQSLRARPTSPIVIQQPSMPLSNDAVDRSVDRSDDRPPQNQLRSPQMGQSPPQINGIKVNHDANNLDAFKEAHARNS